MNLHYLKSVLALIFIFIFSSCGTTYIYYQKGKTVKSAFANKGNPPDRVQATNVDIGIGNWRLDALSASPDANYLALGMADINSPTSNSNGKLEVYSNFGARKIYTFNDADLKSMIEGESDVDYPNSVYAFHPFDLGYENDTVLIAHIQPWNSSDLIPQDVELRIDLKTGEAISVSFFPRTNRPAMPQHDSKNKFNFEVINGEMFVNGNKLNGMPSGLDPDNHDEVTLKK